VPEDLKDGMAGRERATIRVVPGGEVRFHAIHHVGRNAGEERDGLLEGGRQQFAVPSRL